MSFQDANANISGSTLNGINRDQISIGRDHSVYNLSDTSAESLVSVSGSAVISITTSSRKRKGRLSSDAASSNDENGDDTNNRNHTRRQRSETEAKRHDTLLDCYANLKQELPESNEKSTKVNLLRRGK